MRCFWIQRANGPNGPNGPNGADGPNGLYGLYGGSRAERSSHCAGPVGAWDEGVYHRERRARGA